MEEKKTVFDYMGQIFITFGFSILVLNIFCLLVGEDAQDISSLYAMGREGLSVATMMQFFGVSVCITGLRFLFFTDRIMKSGSITLRTAGMLTSIVGVILLCTVAFGWFPVDMWQSWASFFCCFILCFIGSCLLTRLKERTENRKMEEALERLKTQDIEKQRGNRQADKS